MRASRFASRRLLDVKKPTINLDPTAESSAAAATTSVTAVTGVAFLLFSAEYKPRGYYLEHFWQDDMGYIGHAIIGFIVPNSSHVACILQARVGSLATLIRAKLSFLGSELLYLL